MIFNGIDAVQKLAGDVNAKAFVIHEKGVKSRTLRQRSVGSVTKVKNELDKFAAIPEYQNGQYFIMFFDESVPRSSRENSAIATAEFSLGAIAPSPIIPQQPAVQGLSIGEIEQRAGQIAENAILKYQLEQKDKEIKDLEQEIDEPKVDYTETILSALSGFLGQTKASSVPNQKVNGIITPDTDIIGANGQSIDDTKSIEQSVAQLERIVGGKKQLAEKLKKLVIKLKDNPMLLNFL
jgi:hypothetical protein